MCDSYNRNPKKDRSEFPFAKRTKRNAISDFPEVIEEDRLAEEDKPVYERKSRFAEMRDYNEFGGGKRYRSEDRLQKKNHNNRLRRTAEITSKIFNLPSAYVSETEDEESKSSEEGKNQRQSTNKQNKL